MQKYLITLVMIFIYTLVLNLLKNATEKANLKNVVEVDVEMYPFKIPPLHVADPAQELGGDVDE